MWQRGAYFDDQDVHDILAMFPLALPGGPLQCVVEYTPELPLHRGH